MASSEGPFLAKDKLVVLRLFRLGRLPPALSAVELLAEAGVPCLVVEYGNLKEPIREVPGAIPRLRLEARWAALLPAKLRPPAIWLVTALKLAFRFAVRGRPRLLLAEGLHEQAMAYLLCRLTGVAYAVHVHEIYEKSELSTINRLFFRLEGPALRKASFLIFPESTRSRLYQERYRLENPRFVVFNAPRKREAEKRPELKQSWAIPEGHLVMGYIGGIGPTNGIEEAIRALRLTPRIHFFLWGWGEPAYLDSLRTAAAACGTSERVRFMGELGATERWRHLEACDIGYCVYSHRDLRMRYQATASNKLMEFIASGVPVVTSNSPDFRSLVEGNGIGACAPELTPQGIASALTVLCAPGALPPLSRKALELHRSSFNYEAQFEACLTHFKEIFHETHAVSAPIEKTRRIC